MQHLGQLQRYSNNLHQYLQNWKGEAIATSGTEQSRPNYRAEESSGQPVIFCFDWDSVRTVSIRCLRIELHVDLFSNIYNSFRFSGFRSSE